MRCQAVLLHSPLLLQWNHDLLHKQVKIKTFLFCDKGCFWAGTASSNRPCSDVNRRTGELAIKTVSSFCQKYPSLVLHLMPTTK
jgi:hypothetical protein